jgi:hypothetical protein
MQTQEIDMDIFDQVAKLLKDMENREKKTESEYQSAHALLLAKLFEQYNLHVKKKQWKSAHDCLVDIITLGAAMLVKPGSGSSGDGTI